MHLACPVAAQELLLDGNKNRCYFGLFAEHELRRLCTACRKNMYGMGGTVLFMVNRRQFVKTVGFGALAGAGIGAVGVQADASTQTDANPDNPKSTRLLPGCCAYSYDKELRHGPMTLEDFILKAADLRLAGVDMTVYYLKSTDPEYLHSLRHLDRKSVV